MLNFGVFTSCHTKHGLATSKCANIQADRRDTAHVDRRNVLRNDAENQERRYRKKDYADNDVLAPTPSIVQKYEISEAK